MRVDSYFELATTLIGWHTAETIAEILTSSGLVYLPFGIALARNWSEPVRSQEAKYAAPVSLRRMEQDICIALIVIIFFFLPAVPVNAVDVEFAERGQSKTISAQDPASPYTQRLDKVFQVRVPLIWWLVHEVASYITGASIATLDILGHPSHLRAELLQIQKTKLTDEVVINEVRQFREDCYEPALAKFQQTVTPAQSDGTGMTSDAVDWIGSRYFVQTPGYYKRCANVQQCGTGYKATQKATKRIFDKSASEELYCDEWWAKPVVGLRARIITALETQGNEQRDNIERMRKLEQKKLKRNEPFDIIAYEDIYLRRALHGARWTMVNRADRAGQRHLLSIGNLMTLDGWQQIIATAGSLAISFILHAAMEFVLVGLPMLQALMLMLIYISIPLIVPYAMLQPAILVRLIFLIFTIRFVTVLWAIAEFLDEKLLEQMYPDANRFEFAGSGTGADAVLSLITLTAYLTLPMIWLFVMSAAGSTAASSMSAGLNQIFSGHVQAATSSSTMATRLVTSRFKSL